MQSKEYKHGLFIFRRDLRLVDNLGLYLLSEVCEKVYTIFIFTPEQGGSGNKYKSSKAVQFMIESLEDLSREIKKKGGKLMTFYGHNDQIIAHCIDHLDIDIVVFNMDITPYANERDTSIAKLCAKKKVHIAYGNDYYLHEPGSIVNGSGQTYVKFTPYYHAASKIPVPNPMTQRALPLTSPSTIPRHLITLDHAKQQFVKERVEIPLVGGRTNALKQLHGALRRVTHYGSTRDDLSKPTSELSAYIKFGCLSIREIYHAFKSNSSFIRQLYWREFYANVLYAHPELLRGRALHSKYNKISWHHNKRWLDAWCEGKTGFPLVDAGMRQLNATGYMHNRARLITMSFLIKIMMIDWREGERYFAQHLVDYDPASNNGNTLWVMGGGADSMPWFRYFNPWLQTEEHDPDCEYIREWIPELRDIPVKDILKWETECLKYKDSEYPAPILDYAVQKQKSIQMYKRAL